MLFTSPNYTNLLNLSFIYSKIKSSGEICIIHFGNVVRISNAKDFWINRKSIDSVILGNARFYVV